VIGDLSTQAEHYLIQDGRSRSRVVDPH
jgi:hypothetical protein